MTNRSKTEKRGNPLRFLDLSFEGRQRTNPEEINNGLRPHGGHKGKKKHPPSPLSFDKTREYHEKLREDIDRLLEEDELKVHGSPAWACDVSREIHHGGESPLLAHRFLSASRVETPKSAGSQRHVKSAKSRIAAPPMREGVTFYRPNRTHQYLTSTELKDCGQGDTALKYGRPTRTTLLRARQRSNSSPINAYEVRREMIRRAEERKSKSNHLPTKQEMSDSLNIVINGGESSHSWLIGARYNRQHLVDPKSLLLYGMYMPRNNPLGNFHTHSMMNLPKEDDMGSNSPDSSTSDEEEYPSKDHQRVVSAPALRKQQANQSPPLLKKAWGESTTSLNEFTEEHKTGSPKGNNPVLEELIVWSDALNVKGSRVFTSRVENEKRPVLPVVQGVSWRSPRRRDKTEESSLNSQPPPPTPIGLTSSKGEQPEDLKLEELITKRSYSSRGPLSDKSSSEPQTTEPRLSAPKKIRPVLVDRSVNVPSVSGDSALGEAPIIGRTLQKDNKLDSNTELKIELDPGTPSSTDDPANTHNTPVEGSVSSPDTLSYAVEKTGTMISSEIQTTDYVSPDITPETSAGAGADATAGTTDDLHTETNDTSPSPNGSISKNVTFFITEDDDSKVSDSIQTNNGNALNSELDINASHPDPFDLNGAANSDESPSDREPVESGDMDEDINSPKPVIQVTVDITKKDPMPHS